MCTNQLHVGEDKKRFSETQYTFYGHTYVRYVYMYFNARLCHNMYRTVRCQKSRVENLSGNLIRSTQLNETYYTVRYRVP